MRDSFVIAYNDWVKNKGDYTLRLNYKLRKDSIVFDVGGYKGEWSEKIVNLYNPNVFIFEPIPVYYIEIVEKFKSNKNVFVYNFGLSDSDDEVKISLLNNGSSIYRTTDKYINVKIRDISLFIKENNIKIVDLIKINIEGSEYVLLKRMIDEHIIGMFTNIQVQFHKFYPNSKQLRDELKESLSITHFNTYDYPFVWEGWQKKL